MELTGYLLVNKPRDMTSHDVVDAVRGATGVRRVGHAGTLDPLASGLLIVLVGREATREQARFMKLDKEYIATMELGKVSDTYDSEGVVKSSDNAYRAISVKKDELLAILESFTGVIEQVPPAHSAIKVGGKKAYELARAGKEVQLKSRKIQIFEIKLLRFEPPLIDLKIHCSSGTYIRSLVHDIGRKLDTGAIMTGLVRTKIGEYMVGDAIGLDRLDEWRTYIKAIS